MGKIRKETIQKALLALNQIEAELNANKRIISSDRAREICKENKIDNTILTKAVSLGFYVRNNEGFYRKTVEAFEPIHARRIIQRIHEMRKASITVNKSDKVVSNRKTAKKQISILWGLIKFTL